MNPKGNLKTITDQMNSSCIFCIAVHLCKQTTPDTLVKWLYHMSINNFRIEISNSYQQSPIMNNKQIVTLLVGYRQNDLDKKTQNWRTYLEYSQFTGISKYIFYWQSMLQQLTANHNCFPYIGTCSPYILCNAFSESIIFPIINNLILIIQSRV